MTKGGSLWNVMLSDCRCYLRKMTCATLFFMPLVTESSICVNIIVRKC